MVHDAYDVKIDYRGRGADFGIIGVRPLGQSRELSVGVTMSLRVNYADSPEQAMDYSLQTLRAIGMKLEDWQITHITRSVEYEVTRTMEIK